MPAARQKLPGQIVPNRPITEQKQQDRVGPSGGQTGPAIASYPSGQNVPGRQNDVGHLEREYRHGAEQR
jgi:hypothetical protein